MFKKITFGLILLITVLSVHNTAIAQERIIDRLVAVVGNSIILQSEIENELLQFQAQGVKPSHCEIIEDYLVRKLLLNQAIIDSIVVTDAEVEMELNRRLQYFVMQAGSEQKLEDYYNKSILEIKEDFRSIVRDQIVTEYMEDEIIGNVTVTPAEVRRYFNSLDEEEIPMVPSEVEIRRIVRYPEFSEAEAFRIRLRLNEIRQRIINGESFSTLAVLYSQDPGSARRGGELGYMLRSQLTPAFANVIFAMRDEKVSSVFETDYGFHIAQLIDRQGEQVNARHILIRPEATDIAREEAVLFLDSLAGQIRSNALTFPQAAARYTQDDDTRLNGGLVINPETRGSRFELDQLNEVQYEAVRNLKVGEISDPVESRDNSMKTFYKLLYLSHQTAPHRANLRDDYEYIKNMALAKKKQNILEEWIAEKRLDTFIRIDEAYRNCEFAGGDWVAR